MCRTTTLAALLIAILAAAPAGSLEDPTRPPSSLAPAPTDAAPPALELTAILARGEQRVAVIDGRTLREGDRLGADTVVRIEPTRVELRGPDGLRELTLYGPPVKTPTDTLGEPR